MAAMPASAAAAAESADAANTVAHAVEAANAVNHAHHITQNIFVSTFTNVAGMVGIVAGGVMSFIINHSAFKERKAELVDEYRWYLAARYNKEPEAVNKADLEAMAFENPTIEQSLNRGRTIRNVNTSALVAASCLAALVVTGLLVAPALPFAAWAAAAAGEAFFTVATMKVVALALAASYATTKVGSKILTAVGLRALKADSPTAQSYIDHIETLQEEHKRVPEELVFGAYVASDPFAMEQIRQTYKKPFHELKPEQKQAVIEVMQGDELFKDMDLKSLTEAINNGSLEAKELAFLPHKQEGLIEQTKAYIEQTKWKEQIGTAVERTQQFGQQVVHSGQQAVQGAVQGVQSTVQGAVDTTRQWAQSIRPQPQQAQPQMQQPVQPRSIAPDAVKGSRTGAQMGV